MAIQRREFHKFLLGATGLAIAPMSESRGDFVAEPEGKGADSDNLSGPGRGPWRRLFLDSAVIEEQSGLERKFHSTTKHSDQPILIGDKPWEGKSAITGPYVYGTVMKEGNLFRLWYQILHNGNHVGYAESSDGVHWEKPELGIFEYEGKPTNLVVSELDVKRTGGLCHNPSVVKVVNPLSAAEQYALYGFDGTKSAPTVAYSPDGVHWRYVDSPSGSKLFSSSDVVNFAYDPYEQRYYSTWKSRNRRGRAVGIAWSKNGREWAKPIEGPVFAADDLDPSDTQIYGMPVFAYQGLYIGTPWIYRARYFRYGEYSVEKLHEAQADSPRNMEVQLAWSWDLVSWTRSPNREQFISRGHKNSWDHGMIVTARAPIVVGDELYFYYGGTDGVHDDKRVRAAIGLAKIRLDGFCSMSSNQSASGWLITRREPLRSPSVWINAKTEPGGAITAEILDRKNRVIPGFERANCIAFHGDSVRHELKWKNSQFTPAQLKSEYKLRFWIDKASLYSYLPTVLDPNEPDLARFPQSGP